MGRYHQTKLNFGRYDRTKKKKFGGWLVLMTITAFILLAAAWLYFNKEQTADLAKHETRILQLPPAGTGTDRAEGRPETLPAGTEPAPENVQAEPEPETVAVLPALDSSDGFVREELLKLSPSLASWFDTPQMLRKFLLIVNDFSQGLRLEKNMRFLKPKQAFIVDQDASGLYMAPSGYHRYDALAAAINTMDDKAAVAFYKKIRPLLLQIYAEFSYPAGYQLEDLFRKAAAEIISAPIRTERLAVVRPSVHYKFADPALEALNPVHKQMLRLGPENTKIIQNKLRRLVEALSESGE
jgi:hypothetical protein